MKPFQGQTRTYCAGCRGVLIISRVARMYEQNHLCKDCHTEWYRTSLSWDAFVHKKTTERLVMYIKVWGDSLDLRSD